MPSQSRSLSSHWRAAGPTEPLHAPKAPSVWQACVPATHSPVSVPHARVAGGTQPQPSSAAPLQLSSSPLQRPTVASLLLVVVGPVPPVQAPHTPFVHVREPKRHTPTLLPHGSVAPFKHSQGDCR